MERLTERTAVGILVKEDYGENALRTLYSCYGGKPNPHYTNCEEGYCAMEKLAAYEDAEEQGLPNRWIPCSERLPECCGYPVLLTVENGFNQRHVCKAFTNYMKEGKLLFLTNEKEYCEELISSKLSNAWKPIAWMPLPEPYGESEGADGE